MLVPSWDDTFFGPRYLRIVEFYTATISVFRIRLVCGVTTDVTIAKLYSFNTSSTSTVSKCIKHLTCKNVFRETPSSQDRKNARRKVMTKLQRLRKIKRTSAARIRKAKKESATLANAQDVEETLFGKLVKIPFPLLEGNASLRVL